jgi:TonB family protein
MRGRAAASSVAMHIAAVAVMFTVGGTVSRTTVPERKQELQYLVSLAPAPVRLKLPGGGGGGGGENSTLPASRGRAPKADVRQFTPPLAHANPGAKLLMEPSVVLDVSVRLPEASAPVWGDPFSNVAGPPSGGPGSGGGFGSGGGGGIGPGQGPGVGPGSGGGFGGGARSAGPGSPLVVLYRVEPEYSDEARKAKLNGTVIVKIVVDEQGTPRRFEVVRPLGLGLDEAAIEAVRQWRFRAPTRNGRPYTATAFIEVSFRLL